MDTVHDELDQLIDAVLTSRKYKRVYKDFIRAIGAQELAKRHTLKEAIKATKNKLHQVGSAYLDGREDYASWLDELKWAVQSGNRDTLLSTCVKIMSSHASTRERLPILDQCYATVLANLPPIRSVLDIACGLNPLAIPWMPLAEDVEYHAYDIYQDMMDFLNECMTLMHVQGHVEVCDVTRYCPSRSYDVAFILKALPCLDQVDKTASSRLLHTINAEHLLVSFPVHSLGGKEKGMTLNYEARFRQLVADTHWSIKRFEFNTELVYLVTK